MNLPGRHTLRREPDRRHTGPETWGHTLRRETRGHTDDAKSIARQSRFDRPKQGLNWRRLDLPSGSTWETGRHHTRRETSRGSSIRHRSSRNSTRYRHRSIHPHQFLNRTESCWFGKLRLTRGHQRHPSTSRNSLSRPSHHSRSVLLVWRWSVYADGYNRLSTEDDQAEGSLLFDFGSRFFRVRRGL